MYSVPLTADQNNEPVYVELFALDNLPKSSLFILMLRCPKGIINNVLQKWSTKFKFLSLVVYLAAKCHVELNMYLINNSVMKYINSLHVQLNFHNLISTKQNLKT